MGACCSSPPSSVAYKPTETKNNTDDFSQISPTQDPITPAAKQETGHEELKRQNSAKRIQRMLRKNQSMMAAKAAQQWKV